MMEEKEGFDLESDFIEYWDDVIRIWLNQIPITCKSTYQPISVNRKNRIGENIYKDSFSVAIEDEQMSFFQHHQLRDLLCPAHMPEPYWGDPNENKCSLVVVDYNPGGGEDMSPHTYKSTIGNNQYPPNTMIKYVNEYSYSKLAKDFPIWKKDLPADKSWLSSYGGRDKFWLKKKKWVQHLVDCCVEEVKVEDCPPFAIELCGWHSPNWPDNTGAFTDKDNTDLQETVAKRFALPLLTAIENSKSHLAICIGAQFKPSILRAFLPQLENITGDVYLKLSECTYPCTYPDNPGKKEKCIGDESISVTVKKNKKETTRYYRVYNVEGRIILNTFAPGGNHHPAKEYWDFDNKLIEAIEKWKKTGNNTLK